MTETTNRDKEPVYSSRRKRSLHRKRLMDIDKSANPDQLPPAPVVVKGVVVRDVYLPKGRWVDYRTKKPVEAAGG